jgi:prepilin signal peptidase PulO-like enzyme (type II secretory pathway)
MCSFFLAWCLMAILNFLSIAVQDQSHSKLLLKNRLIYYIKQFCLSLIIVLALAYYGITSEFFILLILFCYMTIIIPLDIKHRIIPNEISFSLIIVGLLTSWTNPFLYSNTCIYKFLESFIAILLGIAIVWGIAIIGQKLFKQEVIGGGDMKLIGGFSGFLGIKSIFFILLYASILGSIFGIFLLLKHKKRNQIIPFAPFICLGVVIWIYFGNIII